MTKPNAPRGKKDFSSDFLPLNKDDIRDSIKDRLDVYNALKISFVKDKETEIMGQLPPHYQTYSKHINKLEYDEYQYLYLFENKQPV